VNGIVAIVSRDRRVPVSETELEELAGAHEACRGQSERLYASAPHVRVAVLERGQKQPRSAIDAKGESFAAWIGTIHHDGSLLRAKLDEIEGHWGIVRHDSSTGDVVVATDPRAFQPMYVAEHGEKIYLSDSAIVLARHLRARPSTLGMLTFLRTGYHFGKQSHWDGIERLEPGAYVRFGAAGREEGFYWRPIIDREVAGLGFKASVDRCLDVATETCTRWLDGAPRTWVDLTGGFDGRLLSLLLTRIGVPFDTNTRGDYTGDRAIARKVADVTGWEWWDLTVPDDWDRVIVELLPRAVAWSDAHLDPLELSWVLWAHGELSRRHQSLLYGGGGEHLRGYTWRQEFPLAGKTKRVNWSNWLDLRLIHPVGLSVFAKDPTPEVRSDMLARMRAWAAPYADELNTTQLDWMFSYKMTGHFGIYRSADALYIRSEVPLYSKAMYQTAISVNYRWRRNHRLERHMIHRLDPRVAAVETDSGGPAEPWRPSNLHRFAPYYTQYARRAVNKLGQKAIGRSVLARDESAHWWCPPDARRAVLQLLLADGKRPSDVFRSARLYDPRRLDDLMLRAKEDEFEDMTLFARIAAVELALSAADATVEDGAPPG
jgi:asparagine synthetase B (glutamine-hydrolysing)